MEMMNTFSHLFVVVVFDDFSIMEDLYNVLTFQELNDSVKA